MIDIEWRGYAFKLRKLGKKWFAIDQSPKGHDKMRMEPGYWVNQNFERTPVAPDLASVLEAAVLEYESSGHTRPDSNGTHKVMATVARIVQRGNRSREGETRG